MGVTLAVLGLSVENGRCGEGSEGGGGGWRGWSCWGSSRTLFLFIFLKGACLVVGGKENMWAVRAVGMEACGWGRWV